MREGLRGGAAVASTISCSPTRPDSGSQVSSTDLDKELSLTLLQALLVVLDVYINFNNSEENVRLLPKLFEDLVYNSANDVIILTLLVSSDCVCLSPTGYANNVLFISVLNMRGL